MFVEIYRFKFYSNATKGLFIEANKDFLFKFVCCFFFALIIRVFNMPCN